MSAITLTQSASTLGRAIEAGKLDPRDLTEAYLSVAESHQFRDRIFTMLTPIRARAEAQAASQRARSGLRRSPLDGVPITWKDLFDTAGYPTEGGSALLKGRIPSTDAEVLQNAARAGLVMKHSRSFGGTLPIICLTPTTARVPPKYQCWCNGTIMKL